jgi:ATP-dependent helicase/DNAse subunit B
MQILTNSRLRCFRACKRLHFYKYELDMEPRISSSAARFGSLFHDGQEEWWKPVHDSPSKQLIAAKEAAAMAFYGVPEGVDLDEFLLETVLQMTEGYHYFWVEEQIEPIKSELEFVMPLVNPETGKPSRTFIMAGKIDAIALIEGQLWVVEHKTTIDNIEAGGDYWKRLRIDSQVSTYYNAVLQLFPENRVAGCLYDVIQRPLNKPFLATPPDKRKYNKKTGEIYKNQHEADETPKEFGQRIRASIVENPSRYFQRGKVVRLDEEIEAYQHELWLEAKHLRAVQLSGHHLRNPDSCIQYGRTCEFFDVCTGVASLDDPTRFGKKDLTFPELSAETQADVG